MHSKKTIWTLIAIILILVLAFGGFFAYRQHQTKARIAAAGKVFDGLSTKQQTLSRRADAKWVDGDREFVRASTTTAAVGALQKSASALATQAQPYQSVTDASVKRRYQAFSTKQQALTKRLKTLRTATKATAATNALFDGIKLKDATLTDAVIKAATSEADLAKLTAPKVNAALTQALQQAQKEGRAQLKERTALKAQVATIAEGNQLKASVTLAALQAYQAFVAKLQYPKLADHALTTAVAAKIKALDNIHSLSTTELNRRILAVYAKNSGATNTDYLTVSDGKFDGDNYSASVLRMNFQGADIGTVFSAKVSIKANGDYTIEPGVDAMHGSGNLLHGISSTGIRQDTAKPVVPTLTASKFEQIMIAYYNKDAGDMGPSFQPAGVMADTEPEETSTSLTIYISSYGEIDLRYDKQTGAVESRNTRDVDGFDYSYDADATEAVWAAK